jgi:hypothetical protein
MKSRQLDDTRCLDCFIHLSIFPLNFASLASFSFFESVTPSNVDDETSAEDETTAAATTGPAQGPRPACGRL